MLRLLFVGLIAAISFPGCGGSNPQTSSNDAKPQPQAPRGPAPKGPAPKGPVAKKKNPKSAFKRPLADKARFDRIAAIYDSGNYTKAIEQFQEYVKAYPKDKEAWTLLGHSRRKTGQPQIAEDAYKKAVAIDPDFGSALIGLAIVYRERGEFERSRQKYEHAQQSDPTDERPLSGLALLSLRMFDDKAAVVYAEQAFQISKTSVQAAVTLAIAYHHVGDTRNRDRMAQRAKQLGHSNPTFLTKVFANELHFRANLFQPKGAEWSIPVKAPRDPVLLSDYKRIGRNSDYDESSKAFKLFRRAEQLMFSRNYSNAELTFEEALQLAPNLAVAAYQRSCNYALWGKPKEAKQAFDHAVKLGFADYPICYRDTDLGVVRAYKEFKEQLKTIRERYLKLGAHRVGTPIVVTPKEPEPKRPVILLLHGYGDTHEAYIRKAQAWAKLGFVAIAMPGSVPRRSGGFIWDERSVETTHKQVQLAINSPLVAKLIDSKKVFLLGFSQGAMHAWQIVVRHPGMYAGAVAISPGGRPWHKSSDQPNFGAGKPRLWFTSGKRERSKTFISERLNLYRRVGVPFKFLIHSGGHHFPRKWPKLLPDVAKYLLHKEPPTKNPFDS